MFNKINDLKISGPGYLFNFGTYEMIPPCTGNRSLNSSSYCPQMKDQILIKVVFVRRVLPFYFFFTAILLIAVMQNAK